MTEKEAWALQLDWLNIISILGLDTINQIPESKKERVIRKITKLYGSELLLSFNPSELDELVANELRTLMKKEIISHVRRKERQERQMRAKMAPFRNPGVMRIDMNEIKDMNQDDLMKLMNKFMGKKDDDEEDEDDDKYSEDKDSYYI